LGRTFTGWIAPACGWRTYSITGSICRSASIFRTTNDYLFKCRDCKHNGDKDRTCIGDKRAIMCADCAYALPDDHKPRNIATDKHAQSVR